MTKLDPVEYWNIIYVLAKVVLRIFRINDFGMRVTRPTASLEAQNPKD
jgi:hypothetical protein